VPQTPVLDVYSSTQPAGTLARSEVHEGDFLFGYSPDCPKEDAVSLTMPVVRDQYDSMNTVHPIFEMNLPEGALLDKLRMRFAKLIPNFDDLALLEIVGHSQIGRLRYTGAGAAPADPSAESLSGLLTYSGTEDLFADLLERYAAFSGVAGMQPKVLIRAGEGPVDRLMHRGTTHIVKSFDPRDFPELAANEYFCTRAAVHAGLPVARLFLSDNRRLLVSERFDLREDGSYLGMEDFCVLNALRSNGRYNSSYEVIAKRIREFVSTEEVPKALEQFFLTLALCCAIENGDAHLKNLAVMYQNAEAIVSLAPAYDLICTTLYQPKDSLALTLNDSKSFPRATELTTFALRHCNLPAAKVKKLLHRIAHGLGQAQTEVRLYIRTHEDFRKAGERLIERFNHGLQRLELG
jgi:serine/threonine-protein kinase HipA